MAPIDGQQLVDDLIAAIWSVDGSSLRSIGEALRELYREHGIPFPCELEESGILITNHDVDGFLRHHYVPDDDDDSDLGPDTERARLLLDETGEDLFQADGDKAGWQVVQITGTSGVTCFVSQVVEGSSFEGLVYEYAGAGRVLGDARTSLQLLGYLDHKDLMDRYPATFRPPTTFQRQPSHEADRFARDRARFAQRRMGHWMRQWKRKPREEE